MVYAELMHAKNVVKYLIMEVSLSFTKELTLVIIHEHVKDVIPKSQTVEVLKFIQNYTEMKSKTIMRNIPRRNILKAGKNYLVLYVGKIQKSYDMKT